MKGVPLSGLRADVVGTRVVVTGAAGYLGRHLVAALAELGCAVVACDQLAGIEARRFVHPLVVDVRDRSELEHAFHQADVVFHCAAVLSLAGMAPPAVADRVWSVNVDGTQAVLDACRAAGVGRLVYVSSANVCIDREILEADESAPYATEFVDLYGPSKVEAERRVLAANSPELRTLAVRPGGIWGPGEGGFMVKTFLDQLAAGRFVATIGDGQAVVDNTHVFSLARAMLLGATALHERPAQVGGRAFFITDDERINGIEWFRPIVEGLGERFPTRRLPAGLMYWLAWLGEVGHRLGLPEPQLTRIGVLKLTRGSAFRVDAARELLGYEPLTGSREGIAAHLEDYRETVTALRSGR